MRWSDHVLVGLSISSLTLGNILEAHIQHGIVQGTTHEKLEGEIVDALGIAEGLTLLRAVPLRHQAVAESKASRRVCCRLVAVVQTPGEGRLNVANDFLLEAIAVLERLRLVLCPCFALRLGD